MDPQTTLAKSSYPLVDHCPFRVGWCKRARAGTSASLFFQTTKHVARGSRDEAVQSVHPQVRDTEDCENGVTISYTAIRR